MKNRTSLFLLVILTISGCKTTSFQQHINPISSSISIEYKIDSLVATKMNLYNIPGLSIGVIRNDSIIHMNGYGVDNIEANDPITAKSIFHTASISKIFTALAILELVNEETLSLDDKLVDLIPELNYSDDRIRLITIKSILNHTSGLPDVNNYNWEYNHQSDNSLKKYVLGLKLNLRSIPSEEFHYSNLGYDILGYVVESSTGITFDDYVKDKILTKSGMTDSDFRYFKIPESLRTSPHSKSRFTGKIYVRNTYPYNREHGPSSTLNSSSKELSLWMISFLNKMENNPLHKNMTVPSSIANPNIGLGFQLYKLETGDAIGHFGGDKGFRSFLMMIPKEKIGVVVLANCDYEEDFRQEIVNSIAEMLLSSK